KDGRDLAGTFTSDLAGVNTYRFPGLYGSLHWTPTLFEITKAGSKFYGGDAQFEYSIKPLGSKTRPTDRFDVTLGDVDLARFTDFEEFPGLRFAGAASLRNRMEWPAGHFSDHRGDGRLVVVPRPSTDHHLPIAGELNYQFDPGAIAIASSRFATGQTTVTFDGSTAWGDRSRLPFHVSSTDWQESDRLLAGIMTDFGSPTDPVAFGGHGEFDGVMTGAFRRPRVTGTFRGQDMRAMDTDWGGAVGNIAVEGSYLDVSDGVIQKDGSEIRADGRFSLGYPRDDGGEEINARIRVARRDVDSLRHAFQIDEYPVSGYLSGEFHLTGLYTRPIGFGGMSVDEGIAYGEPFEKATASLRFDGGGVRLDDLAIAKSTGTVTGAAYVGWDGTYAFNVDGRRIPVERIEGFKSPRASLSGLADFSANGNGRFDAPRYDVKFHVTSLTIAQEIINDVTGTIGLRGRELSGEVDAASPRLTLTGTGRISLNPGYDAELTFRFHDASLDPYVRLVVPGLSPYTTAALSGSMRVLGALADPERLAIDGTVETLNMKLFDYAIQNASPVHLTMNRGVVGADDIQLVGEDTRLRLSGSVDFQGDRIALKAAGDANLGILQGFFRDVRGSGRAELTASIDGPLKDPILSGNATITAGRVRYFSLPNSLEDINGVVRFDSSGIRLDELTASLGGGTVHFGGRIGLSGYQPSSLNVTMRGEQMRLRYPEGIRSLVDADLALTGTVRSPTLGGTVTVRNAIWGRRIDTPGSIFDLSSRRSPSTSTSAAGSTAGPAVELDTPPPMQFNIHVIVPSTLQVENNVARMVASADLTLRGSYDRPIVNGHADIERGEVNFEGRRYRITRGAIEFANPNRFEPFFDVEAETQVRVPGQTYRVTVGLAGTAEQVRPTLNSDPPLPTADVLALLFSDTVRTGAQDVAPELRALQNPNQAQTDILTTRATQALTAPISTQVGKVVEQTFGVDTFQLAPSFIDPYSQQTARVNPTARLTIGKRISDRVYLTFSRSLNSAFNDQVVLLEYDATDLVSWILSRNEDEQSYALEFRVRHVF
ncbi:MAG TPA: translocation/assembly module TamB domain-containing protein, partial [Vicinamibacterales bacterium]|nr:translocation/assembly module TamB domain-containing protein [Vicinamibacterales bacterium]